MYRENINILKQHEIKIEVGLSSSELKLIEEVYSIRFPKSLRDFLMLALPVSEGFYNWRDDSAENISTIKKAIDEPKKTFNELAGEAEWCESWGDELGSVTEKATEVKKRLQKAPTLIPVYAHRYVPMVENDNPPILSVHGTDVIYYGESLADYLEVEFGDKKQEDIAFDRIQPVPFWSEIM